MLRLGGSPGLQITWARVQFRRPAPQRHARGKEGGRGGDLGVSPAQPNPAQPDESADGTEHVNSQARRKREGWRKGGLVGQPSPTHPNPTGEGQDRGGAQSDVPSPQTELQEPNASDRRLWKGRPALALGDHRSQRQGQRTGLGPRRAGPSPQDRRGWGGRKGLD